MSKSFAPSPQELALVGQIFARVDKQKLGILTGDVAVEVFQGSHLPAQTLGEIWQLADSDNQGFLTRKGVAVALRLIGHAQKGETVTAAYANKPGPLAEIEGYAAPAPPAPARAMSPQMTGPPPLTPADKAKFGRIFAGCGPVNGLVTGEKARDVFMKSKLPMDKLSSIWNLADTKGRGSLDLADFTVGMYLIQACMSGQLPFVPTSLPPGLYEQAGGLPAGVATHGTGSSGFQSPALTGGFPGRAPIAQQYTGASTASPMQQQMTGSKLGPPLPARNANPAAALGASAFGITPQFTGQSQGPPWDVTAAEKVNSDRFFDGIDTQRAGFIEGDAAVSFLTQSGLPGDVLATIWDLSDINDDGRLTKDEFAVAMHLIQNQLAGKDVPATLPLSLIPPAFRGLAGQGQSQMHVSPAQAHVEPLRDLLWDDTPPVSASQPMLQPQSTGATARPPPPPVPGRGIAPPMPVASPAQDPFGGSTAAYGAAYPASAGPFGNPSALNKDLLGDSDDDEPAGPEDATAVKAASPPPVPFEDKSAEIGNARNQLSSTTRALETTKNERQDVEQRLSGQAAELSALQTQLSTAKVAYETETRLLATLRDRFNTQTSDIQKVRQELITAESDLSASRAERAEVEGALLRDKEEVRGLQRQMKDVGTEAEMLKLETEKAKKEAKQQKGLLAIAKKQLAAREAERAKAEQEKQEAHAELGAMTQEREEVEAELAKAPTAVSMFTPPALSPSPDPAVTNGHIETLAAAVHPLPLSPDVTGASASPSAAFISPNHTGASNNPFARLTGSGPGTPRSPSTFLPFSNAALPTSPGQTPLPQSQPQAAPASSELDDPFGLGSEPSTPPAFPVAHPASQTQAQLANHSFEDAFAVEPEAQAETPRQVPAALDVDATRSLSPSSPTNTDFFSTPPSTAVPSEVHSPSKHVSPAEAAAERARGASATATPTIPGGFPGDDDDDMMNPVQEKEIEESDSSDEDEDVPLSSIANKDKGKGKETQVVAGVQAQQDGTPFSAFDDAFAEKAPVHAPATQNVFAPSAGNGLTPATNAFDSAFEPMTTPQPQPPTAVNGVNVFDEALGNLSIQSGNTDTSKGNLSFDTGFDDNFDFTSASDGNVARAAAPQAQTQAPTNGFGFDDGFGSAPAPVPTIVAAPPQNERTFSFDDAFGLSPQPASGAAPTTNGSGKANANPSFDDAFDVSPAPPINNVDTASSKASALSQFSQFQPPSGAPPGLSTGSTPNSPLRSSTASFQRSNSPPSRTTSPPPRHQSPRPRPSTTSSVHSSHQEKPEKPEPPKLEKARSSRLSIRLPFGKKKNKQEAAPPLPSTGSHLSPPQEVSEGTTPPAEDDIDSVKQLCGMGFSRAQAVQSLEKNDYDVQKALNALLGLQ